MKGSKKTKKRKYRLTTFAEKLYNLVTLSNTDAIGFDPSHQKFNGNQTFSIRNKQMVEEKILPQSTDFNCKLPSLRRQLHYYGFKHLKEHGSTSTWYHQNFKEGRSDLLPKIVRMAKIAVQNKYQPQLFATNLYHLVTQSNPAAIGFDLPQKRFDGLSTFSIRNREIFKTEVLPQSKIFNCTYPSLIRQFCKYGFKRLQTSHTETTWYHRYFQKGHPELCSNIVPIIQVSVDIQRQLTEMQKQLNLRDNVIQSLQKENAILRQEKKQHSQTTGASRLLSKPLIYSGLHHTIGDKIHKVPFTTMIHDIHTASV